MRVLLTGATGFIGSHVARVLVARGHEVHALVRPTSSIRRLAGIEGNLSLVRADLDDPVTQDAVRRVEPDGAIHAAWFVEPGTYLSAVPENLRALEQSARLLRTLAGAGCGRLVNVGSSFEAAAGGPDGGARPRPVGMYSAAKAAVHEVVTQMALEGVRAACAHVFYLYGPGEDHRRLVPALITALLRGEAVDVTDGRQRRDYLHVADIASALVGILEHGGSGSIDVCSPPPPSLAEVFRAIGDATGRGELIRVGARPYGAGEVLRAVGDDRALRSLGWAPAFDLAGGIKDTVEWHAERLAVGTS